MSVLWTVAFLALMAGVCSSLEVDCSYLSLLDHLNLTKNSDMLANVRPVKNWTTPTLVSVDLVVFGILEVNEKSQTFTSHCWRTVGWTNEFLSWNQSDFCGIDRISVRKEMLWFPDIIIQEDVSDTGAIKKSQYTTVYQDGMVVTTEIQRLTITCQMDLISFPFDYQICNITFMSMTNHDGRIVLGSFSNSSVLTELSESYMVTQGEWELFSIAIVENKLPTVNQTYELTYEATIVRRPSLYVINFIIPLLYFLILDVASFFINEARGEKLSFKVTLLLSISVLLLILKDMLPSTEDKLPNIAMYCITIFSLVLISLLEAMLVSFLVDLDNNSGDEAQSSAHARVETQVEASCHKEPHGEAGKGEEKPEKEYLRLESPFDPVLLTRILEEVKAARQDWFSANSVEQDKKKPGRCGRAARIIDTVFFVISCQCSICGIHV
ncbi:5-hydroxytryptamine receptor 3A-like [Centroberyx affinis]|uniref:5-hydroxytryptamine receptor 3A-like n=1 Tax=Centroberyx affinis TaxID=166261 RepID=UPI003A5BDE4E